MFRTRALGLALAVQLGAAGQAVAVWPDSPSENLPLAATSSNEFPRDAEPDGNGGVWTVWSDDAAGAQGLILQHVGPDGEMLLGPVGARVSTVVSSAGAADLLPADDGGVFVAWEDYRGAGGERDLYLQRLSAAGAPLWDPAGVLVARGPDVAIAVGNGGVMARSIDGGDTWTNVSSGTGQSLLGVVAIPRRIMAAGDNATFLESQDLGVTWTVLPAGGVLDVNALDLLNLNHGFAVGDQGEIWTWSGTQWTLLSTVISSDLYGVSTPEYDVVVVVGRDGLIARTTDGGDSWTLQSSGTTEVLNDVSFSSADVGTAVGRAGTILRTVDGGATWVLQNSGTSTILLSVDFFDDQFGIATGYDGTALYTNDGGATWTPGSTPTSNWYMGVSITDASTAVASGTNGVIVKTVDGGASWTVQRPSGSGNDLWEVHAPGDITFQGRPTLIDDQSGGVLVIWNDQLTDFTYDALAQRFDANGARVWASDVQLNASSAGEVGVVAVPRGGGGAIVCWPEEAASDTYYYAQGVDLDGNLARAQPVVVCDFPSQKSSHVLVADAAGGAILGWYDFRSYPYRVYARHLDSALNTRWGSFDDGLPFSLTAQQPQERFSLVADGNGTVYCFWSESREANRGIYAQRRDLNGNVLWPNDDVRVGDSVLDDGYPVAALDGFGGAIVSWTTLPLQREVRAQAVNADGTTRWNQEGAILRNGAGFAWVASTYVIADGNGGAIVIWPEYRSLDFDVYAQNVDRYGYLGHPEPWISSVVDVPNDQGGYATVSWDASYLDAFPNQVITHYSIWRRNPAASKIASPTPPGSTGLASAIEAALSAGLSPDFVADQAATGWAYVDTSPAAYMTSYGYDAPTYGDETPTETPITDYQIVAHTFDPFVFWTSAPASGTSSDDLAPDAPLSLLAAEAGAQVELVWNDGPANVEDVSHYRIYRGTQSGFIVGPSSLLDTSPDRGYVDADPGAPTVYYRVTAVDVHGNESEASNEASAGLVTAAAPLLDGIGSLLMVRQPYPNPTGGATTVAFSLPERASVRVELVDLAGRRVREMDLGSLPAGWHQHSLAAEDRNGRRLASGTYFLRLSSGGETRTTKLLVSR